MEGQSTLDGLVKRMESVGLDFGKLLMVEKLGFKNLFFLFKFKFSDFKLLASDFNFLTVLERFSHF